MNAGLDETARSARSTLFRPPLTPPVTPTATRASRSPPAAASAEAEAGPDTVTLVGSRRRPQPSPTASLVAALWRSVAPTIAEIRRARRRLHGKAVVIAAVVAVSYWALVLSELPCSSGSAPPAVLVLGLVAVGTSIMHDANHDSFSRHRWLNRVLAYTSDTLGASSWLWRFQHNTLHHGNTNVVGFDADIALFPFARLAPSQPWHSWYRGQHIYMWPLYGFLALKNLLVSDLLADHHRPPRRPADARRGAGRASSPRITLGKLGPPRLGGRDPAAVQPVVGGRCAFYLALLVARRVRCWRSSSSSPTASTSRSMLEADAPRRGDDFAAHQLRTTADIASPVPVLGHVFRWLVGGLDHQIEHHLAPRAAAHALPADARSASARACRAHGITYHLHPGRVVGAALAHAGWLRLMSVPG